MRLIPFIDVAGQRAFDELQTVFVPAGGALPAGPYAFLEQYCVEEGCDCRRAILSAVRHGEPGGVLATLGYEWEQAESARELAIVTLEPSGPQSSHSPAILELFRQLVRTEPGYVERLRRHYAEARAPLRAPSPGGEGERAREQPAPRRGDAAEGRAKRQFKKEGFQLFADRDGLEVRVIDYHARPLALTWRELDKLKREASRGGQTTQPG